MSTSSVSAKSGAVAFDSAIRRVTVCWRRVSSCTSTSPLAPASPRAGSLACRRALLLGLLLGLGRRGLGAAVLGGRLDVGLHDPPAGPRALEPRELHAELARHPARDGRGLHALAVAGAVARGWAAPRWPWRSGARRSSACCSASSASGSSVLGFGLLGLGLRLRSGSLVLLVRRPSPRRPRRCGRSPRRSRACRPPWPAPRSARRRCRPRRSCWPCRSRSPRAARRA